MECLEWCVLFAGTDDNTIIQLETIATLDKVGIKYSGVGRNSNEAIRPAIVPIGGTWSSLLKASV